MSGTVKDVMTTRVVALRMAAPCKVIVTCLRNYRAGRAPRPQESPRPT